MVQRILDQAVSASRDGTVMDAATTHASDALRKSKDKFSKKGETRDS